MLKDPQLKLFGRKISLPENRVASSGGDCDRLSEESRGEEILVLRDEDQAEGEVCEENEDEESGNTSVISVSDDEVVCGDEPKKEIGGTNSEQKKPDKILPCPRCKSMDTKFCYFNNYNVNQPRHFCKSCQRYWTAGGSMRNVPVGAGRRKNKNSASNCRHITTPEALQAATIDPNLKFNPNPTVLSFGPSENTDKSGLVSSENDDGGRNGFQQPAIQNLTGFPPPVPCIPWPFPWNSAVPLPTIFPSGYPMPYYAAPFWHSNVPSGWNMPWLSVSASPLGKHSRNGELVNPSKSKSSESSVVVPKTLRIDDPEEAAKSSIWSTLGIKYDSISREGLFKVLESKIDEKKAMASPILQANPAALSRSLAFQEAA